MTVRETRAAEAPRPSRHALFAVMGKSILHFLYIMVCYKYFIFIIFIAYKCIKYSLKDLLLYFFQ
jgi:hypothetical protein